MSSHREAPGILKDPTADNTDVYAFVSPNDTVTIITNYIPVEAPGGGPNFYEFGDDVLYEIHIDNDGDGKPDVTYQFRFETKNTNPDTFLYNTGPIDSLDSPNWNRRQKYSVTKVTRRRGRFPRWAPARVPRGAPHQPLAADGGHRPRRLQEARVVDAVAGQLSGHGHLPQPRQFGVSGAAA